MRKELIEILGKPQTTFANLLLGTGWDKTIIASVNKTVNQKYVGKTVTQMAEELGKDSFDAAFDLLIDEECFVCMVNFIAGEEDNRTIINQDYTSIISDSIYSDIGLPHPRVYGSFPRILQTFVKEEQLISIETAINKMTRKPAEVYRLYSKGLIKEGMDADIVIFDLDNVETKATYTDSKHLATSFDYVIINGEIAAKDDKWLLKSVGKVLKSQHATNIEN